MLAALDRVRDPATGRGLVAAGLVQGLSLRADRAGFMLEVPREAVGRYGHVRAEAEDVLRRVTGASSVQVVLTTAQSPPSVKGAAAGGSAPPGRAPAVRPTDVGAVIAVASGKGGVGKSTVAVNLACAFVALGRRVGVLDADIQGPSIPRLLGLTAKPETTPEKKIIPLEAHGLKALSMGVLMKGDDALVWRGPMIASAMNTLVHETLWGEAGEPLDVLIVDLPPGTGDIQLTLAQKTELRGVLMVATPQALALDDVRRGAAMFRKVEVPILGLVENMAWFEDATGARTAIFGEGGGEALAVELGVPLLAQLPLDPALRKASDAGVPLVVAQPDHPLSRRFTDLAQRLASIL